MKNWLKTKIDAAVEKDAKLIPFTPKEKRQIKRSLGLAVFWGIVALAFCVVSMLQAPPTATWTVWVIVMVLAVISAIAVCIGVIARYVMKLAEELAAFRYMRKEE